MRANNHACSSSPNRSNASFSVSKSFAVKTRVSLKAPGEYLFNRMNPPNKTFGTRPAANMIAAQMAVPRPPFPANVDAMTGSASSVIKARIDGDTKAKKRTMNASVGRIVFQSEYLSVVEAYGD